VEEAGFEANDFLDFIGLPEIRSLEQRFTAQDPPAQGG
jgi:hypothetical protein